MGTEISHVAKKISSETYTRVNQNQNSVNAALVKMEDLILQVLNE